MDGPDSASRVDANLIRVIAKARALEHQMTAADDGTLDQFAAAAGISISWATRLMRLAYLSPGIVAAILGGRQPPGLTANKLMQDTRLQMDWREQKRALGFC